MKAPVLEISDLSVNYDTDRGPLRALRNIDIQIQPGRIIGIVGESGCGKSTLISTIIRLLAPNAEIATGSILFRGNDLLGLDPEALDALHEEDPQTAELVKLRYFIGLTMDEAAQVLGIRKRAAEELWTFGKAWLHRAIRGRA